MTDRSRPDPIRERWRPVGDVLPLFIRLVRASWVELLVIWVIATAGVLATTLATAAIGFSATPSLFGVSLAILPVTFGTAMAAHRVLWPTAPTLMECLDVAARAFGALLVVIAIRQVAMTFGFSLFFLPGLAAAVFMVLAPIIVLAEGPGLQAAFQRSAMLVLPIGWAVLVLLLISALVGLVLLVPMAIIAMPLSTFGDDTLQTFIEAGATASFPLAFTVMGAALYLYVTAAGQTRH
ncbi:MAG: hypothetical protein AAFR41_08045 [Pseudomonadota bacterium]